MADSNMPRISLVTLVVDDYDRAIDFYRGCLGFHLAEDSPLPDRKRWVVVKPQADAAMGLLLARAEGAVQEAAIGSQTGGRVGFFLEVEDFDEAHARMLAAGVHFEEEPRDEPYARVAVFRDLYGNRWDLLMRRAQGMA
jgi:catechol 2,3-dioxygenase-like lactoylglutathione lyase family enzyme